MAVAQDAFVDTAKLALVDPAGTITVAGTVAAAVLPLESATTMPPVGAGPLRVTVPVEGAPPDTLVGLGLKEESEGAVTERTVVVVTPSWVAEIVTFVDADTGFVETANVALVAPAGTVTLAGTVAAAVLLLACVTTTPPVGAVPLSVTVPLEDAPPVMVVGTTLTVDSSEGLTVRAALIVTPLYVATIVTTVAASTG